MGLTRAHEPCKAEMFEDDFARAREMSSAAAISPPAAVYTLLISSRFVVSAFSFTTELTTIYSNG